MIALRQQVQPIRTHLLSTLAWMFPIDLVSPPDLLFSILSVPLPIPVSSTDPAPPLSMSGHPEVNEDSVATALGYSALLVHLTAAYLCKGLIYPITYVGSRSLIKDPISAMVGPRMYVVRLLNEFVSHTENFTGFLCILKGLIRIASSMPSSF